MQDRGRVCALRRAIRIEFISVLGSACQATFLSMAAEVRTVLAIRLHQSGRATSPALACYQLPYGNTPSTCSTAQDLLVKPASLIHGKNLHQYSLTCLVLEPYFIKYHQQGRWQREEGTTRY